MPDALLKVIRLRKGQITRRNVPFGNFHAMTDDSWRNCDGAWSRLKWARKRKFETAKDFAKRVGEKEGTYRAYEREPGSSKWTALDHQNAMRFAKALGVRWEWLLLGQGAAIAEDSAKERINAALEGATPDQADRIAEAIEVLLKSA